ncbi:MAG: hypothetical protein V4858_28820 [Pseudomonadota bacterium]
MIHFPLDSLHREDLSSPGRPCDLLTPPGPVMLGDRAVEVQIWAKAPVSQTQLDAFAGFLNDYASMEIPFAAAIKARYDDKEGDLIEWLEEVLEPTYWAALFPGCNSAAEVNADQYFKTLTLCSVSFHPDPAPDDEEIVADYRFCVPESILLPDHPNCQRYLDRCDLTDQVLAVKAMLDGRLLGVDHES